MYVADPRILDVRLDERTILSRNADIEQERNVAIRDLLEGNHFAPGGEHPGGYAGPYRVLLRVEDGRLCIDISDSAGALLETVVLALSPFRRAIRDYFAVCDSYFKAIRSASTQQIETVDMARRAIHNDAAELLRDRLATRIDVDFDTARRLFTLICVLHIKG